MMTTGGKEEPSAVSRIFWGLLQGVVASILMVIGGVEALQSAAIVTGGPFAIVCLVAVAGLAKTFSDRYGSVILQDETVLFGRTETRSESAVARANAETDDD